MEKFYSTFDVARMCHVSPGSVIRWIREGKLTAALTAGGHHRIRSTDLKTLLESLRMPVPDELKDGTISKGNRILIVDDEKGVRDLLRMILTDNFPGVRIDEAEEGFQAGWKANGMQPDLVILDLNLPGLNGFKVCEFIRLIPELKHTRILAMSAIQGNDVKNRILSLGADDFMAKPFDVDTLKQKISDQLARERKAA